METKMNNSNPNENLPVQYISDDGDSDYDEEQADEYHEEQKKPVDISQVKFKKIDTKGMTAEALEAMRKLK